MRKDIEIHINTGDLHLINTNKGIRCVFQWINHPEGMQRYIYGEVVVPETLSLDAIMKDGITFIVPYTPIYKEIQLRIKKGNESGGFSYIQNSADGSNWFVVQSSIFGQAPRNIFASELKVISPECIFHCQFSEGKLLLYSAKSTDFNIVDASWQNSNLMLACVPTNNYRYPITGVGLIKWVKGNMIRAGLGERLRQEFFDDGTPVIDANYNFNTHQLNLQLDKNTAE